MDRVHPTQIVSSMDKIQLIVFSQSVQALIEAQARLNITQLFMLMPLHRLLILALQPMIAILFALEEHHALII